MRVEHRAVRRDGDLQVGPHRADAIGDLEHDRLQEGFATVEADLVEVGEQFADLLGEGLVVRAHDRRKVLAVLADARREVARAHHALERLHRFDSSSSSIVGQSPIARSLS